MVSWRSWGGSGALWVVVVVDIYADWIGCETCCGWKVIGCFEGIGLAVMKESDWMWDCDKE